MKDLKVFEMWDDFFGRRAEFPEGESVLTVIQNMQSFANQLCSNFSSSYPSEVLAIVFLEGSKFMAAISVTGDDSRHLPEPEQLFSKHVPSMFERLKVPVSGAQWVDKIFRTKKAAKTIKDDEAAAAADQQDGDSKPKGRGRGRGSRAGKAKAKGKAKPKAAPANVVEAEDREDVLADVKMEMADRRQKWWLDDLILCLQKASGRILYEFHGAA